MPERLSSSPEHNERHSAEISKAANERLEQLRNNSEKGEQDPQKRVESAREKIEKQQHEPVAAAERESSEPAYKPLLDRVYNYQSTLRSMQSQLKPASRAFSKVIHNTGIEKTSEVLEKTIMRPSVSLGATATAFIVGLFFYLTARHYGFRLSGSEILLSLVVGAGIGLILEGFFKSTSKTKRR